MLIWRPTDVQMILDIAIILWVELVFGYSRLAFYENGGCNYPAEEIFNFKNPLLETLHDHSFWKNAA